MRARKATLLQSVSIATLSIFIAASPVLADGGTGGGPGGTGGVDNVVGTGGNGNPGTSGSGGGGGGSGATAGAGGAGSGGAIGGTAGSAVIAGGNGANGTAVNDGGGGGGGGATAVNIGFGGPLVDTTSTTGSNGGNGGNGNANGGGGGGGAGGAAFARGGASDTVINGTKTGGNGGNGGSSGTGFGGSGGSGGSGVFVSDGSLTLAAGKFIFGGKGGNGGVGGSGTGRAGVGGDGIAAINQTITLETGSIVSGGNAGAVSFLDIAGGAGISGTNLNIVSSGTISGGLNTNTAVRNSSLLLVGSSSLTFTTPVAGLNGSIAASGSLTINQPTDTVINVPIIGSAAVTKTGAGTLTLTAANGYSGGTTISVGTLEVQNGGALGSGGVTVANGAALRLNSGAGLTLANGITLNGSGPGGAGALQAIGGVFPAISTMTLNGTLSLGSNASINNDGRTDIVANGTVSLGGNTLTKDGSGKITFNAGVSGSGGYTHNRGSTIFNAANTYTGTTTVNGDAVQFAVANSISGPLVVNTAPGGVSQPFVTFSGDNSIASLSGTTLGSVNVNGGVTLSVGSDNSSTTFSGVLRQFLGVGSATFNKIGTGTLTLTDLLSFDNTTINGGTLQIGNGGTTGTTGTGAIVDNAALAFNRSDALTVSNAISGTGSIFQLGTGTTTLTGANTYTGATNIVGGVLSIGSAGNIGTGTIAMGGTPGTLRATGTFSLANAFNPAFAGGTVEVTGANNLTLTGLVTGTTFTKSGTGTLTLNPSTNTHVGGLILAQGTLSLQTSLAAGFGTITTTGSVIDYGNGVTSAAPININSNSTQLQVLTGTATQSGVISETGGPRPLEKIGTGTLALTAANTYSGTTTISGGTLQIGAGGTSGSLGTGPVVDNATLAFNHSDDITVANAVSGTGALNQIGGGTTTLTGALSYTGLTTVSNGSLVLGDAANSVTLPGNATLNGGNLAVANGSLGAGTIGNTNGNAIIVGLTAGLPATAGSASITNGGTVTFQNAGSAGTSSIGNLGLVDFANTSTAAGANIRNVAGGGGLLQFRDNATAGSSTIANGPTGSVIFANSATAGSAAITNGGTLTFSASATAGSATITTNSGAALDGTGTIFTDQAQNAFLSRQIVNPGGLLDITQQTGTTLRFVSIGSLEGSGLVAIGGNSLNVGGNDLSTTFSGMIQNAGLAAGSAGLGGIVNKFGAGTLTLSGANTYTGATSVSAGTLMVDGSLAATSGVAVNSGGTLGGSGTINAPVTINAGGTLSPGTAGGAGVLTTGALTLAAGSLSNFDLATPNVISATNDRVVVNGALALGGTLNANVAASGYYRLFDVNGGGAITGSFGAVNVGGGRTGTVYVNTPGAANQVNLAALGAGQTLQFWDGADTVGNGVADGGTGTWDATRTNWTGAPGQQSINSPWARSVGVFGTTGGTGGAVTVVGTQSFDTLQFSSGIYTLNGGTLALGTPTGGTLNVDGGVITAIGSTIADGAGTALTKVGSGTVFLTGANSYTGGTTISGGQISISNNGALGSGAVTLQNGTLGSAGGSRTIGNAIIAQSGNNSLNNDGNPGNVLTLTGSVTGAGNVTFGGTAKTLVTGQLSYTGTTSISPGTTLATGAANVLSAASATTVNGTLDLGGFNQRIGDLSGSGIVTTNGGAATLTTTNSGATQIFSGTLRDGSGPLALNVTGAGSSGLYLTGANTYTGGTTIASGALLSIGNGTAAGSIVGPVVNDGLLQFFRSTPYTFAGDISGSGNVIIASGGPITFSGANAYSGRTSINPAGTLIGGRTNALSAASATSVNGTLDLGGFSQRIGDLSGASTGVITNNGGAATLTVNDSGVATFFSGSLRDGTGPLALNVTGAGPSGLFLTGTNTYTGGTTIDTGAFLSLGNSTATGSIVGPVVNNGALQFFRSNAYTFAGDISGSGRITISGAGPVTLTGSNTYSGITFINPGSTLIGGRVNAFSASSATSVNGTLDLGGFNQQIGSLSGVGTVTNNGGAATLTTSSTAATTFDGVLQDGSGPLALSVTGAGTTTLTGTNTYTGTTTISAGTLQIGSGGTSGTLGTGAVVDNATLAFNRSDAVTVGNTISGTGALNQIGTGALTLTGASTYTGPTTVSAGSLIVNGSIANSAVTVAAGATLGGSGTVGSTTVLGTISPGNSPGTITIAGNLAFGPGSTYLAEVQGAVADRINVTGTASLAGTLRIVPLGGPYSFGTPYTLLSAAGGRTGTFDTVASTGTAVLPTVTYDATSTILTLRPGLLTPLVPAGAASNPVAVAGGIDRAVLAGADPSAFFALYNLPTAALPAALNTLSGEVQTATSGAVQSAADRFLATLLDPLGEGRLGQCLGGPAGGRAADPKREVCDPAKQNISVWGAAYGGDRRVGGSAATGAATRHDQVWGLATGVDIRLDGDTLLGVAASGGGANASLALGRGSSEANLGQIGAYGIRRFGALDVSGAFAYSFAGARTKRVVSLFSPDRLVTKPDVDGFSGRIEAAYQFASLHQIALSGVAAFQGQSFDRDASLERSVAGANPAALSIAGNSAFTARTELGVKAEHRSGGLTSYVRAAWGHYEARDSSSTASFTALPGSGFRITGARLGRDAALVGAGLSYAVSDRLSIGGRFDGEFSQRVLGVAGSANLTYRF